MADFDYLNFLNPRNPKNEVYFDLLRFLDIIFYMKRHSDFK